MELKFKHGDHVYELNILRKGEDFIIEMNESSYHVKVSEVQQGYLNIQLGEHRIKPVVSIEGNSYNVFLGGKVYTLSKLVRGAGSEVEEEIGREIKSPISGKIVKISVEEGIDVEEKQELMIIEAMNMEHKILAPYNGKIEKLHFTVGSQVTSGQILVEMDKFESDDSVDDSVAKKEG